MTLKANVMTAPPRGSKVMFNFVFSKLFQIALEVAKLPLEDESDF